MTNEQTAVMLGGYLVELNAAIGECDIVSDGEKFLIDLATRLKSDIDFLKDDGYSQIFLDQRPE